MDDLKSRFINQENFYLAFKKVKYYFTQLNEWYDPVELSSYEAILSSNISRLLNDIKNETYTPHAIEPLPFPKKNDSDGKERIRQYFKIHIDDQIVWMAITNIIGSFLEEKMPFWSYGNRLYRPVWFDNGTVVKGSYTTTSEHIYRKWNQSWPFYRRHISMTIKTMAFNKKFTKEKLTDTREIEIYEQEEKDNWKEFIYLNQDFWEIKNNQNLYWAGLDFKNFFPSINVNKVIEVIENALVRNDGTARDDRDLILNTLRKMFKFPIDTSGWLDKNELIDENKVALSNIHEYYGVPTGLLAAGFLANVAMLEVDSHITNYVKTHKNIAIFKYVDDQIILCNSQKELFNFLQFYNELLLNSNTGVKFQAKKTTPGCFKYEDNAFKLVKEREGENELNIDFPKPLMTHTLQKMSHLNEEDYDLADADELEESAKDLEHFLLADFPDTEMRRDTRMAFAAMKLCQLGKRIKPNFKKLDRSSPYIMDMAKAEYFKSISSSSGNFTIDKNKESHKIQQIAIKLAKQELEAEIPIVISKYQRIFELLLKATRENPDKLKLWKRAVEFCFHTGLGDFNLIFKELDKIKINRKGKLYIRSYCLLVLSDLTLRSVNTLLANNGSFWKIYCQTESLRKFLQKTIGVSHLEKGHSFPFVQITLSLFELTRLFASTRKYPVTMYVKTIRTKPIGEIYNASLNEIWFLLSNLTTKERFKLWENWIDRLDLSAQISWSILFLFPNKIPDQTFNQMMLYGKNNDLRSTDAYNYMRETGGILFDVFEANSTVREKYLNDYPKLRNIINYQSDNYIPLNVWIKNLCETTTKGAWLDPRLSEWSLLEIIRQIAEAISNRDKTKAYDIFSENGHQIYKVHPANYLVPRSWLALDKSKITWDIWKELVKRDKIVLLENETLIDDFRYLPITKLWETTDYGLFFGNIEVRTIIQLSVLMIRLLAKSFEWPITVNKTMFIDQLFSNALASIEKEPVSSDTRILLRAIFSKKDLDFFMSYVSFDLDDGSKIKGLADFISKISEIQSKLEAGQLTLINNAPRQLTYIDIDLLNNSKSNF